MRVNEANIFLFLATIIIGILIAMNIGIDGQSQYLDVEQYQKAYDKRTQLQNEISDLEDEYQQIDRKINKYIRSDKTQYEVITEITEELNKNKLILGLAPVVGDGIKITLNDAPGVMSGEKYDSRMLVHDTDLVMVINDLRTAGAEAIMINGYRISDSSSFICSGPTIDINGIKIIAPFYITGIGNKGVIQSFLENQVNHLKTLQARKCFVQIESVYDEKLPAYTGKLKIEYLNQK